MMRPDATCRPTAETLALKIHTTEVLGVQYSGSCCVEDPVSDEDSWEGSVSSDETVEPTSALTELTEISSSGSQTYSPQIEAPLAHNILSKIASDAAAYVARNKEPISAVDPSESLQDSSNQPVPHIIVGVNSSSEFLPNISHESSYDPAAYSTQPWNASPLLHPTEAAPRSISPSPSASAQRRRKHFESIFREVPTSVTLSAPAQSSKAIPSPVDIGPRDVHAATKTVKTATPILSNSLSEAFHRSHEQFECLLLARRIEDPGWRDRLNPLIHSGISDRKGSKLLHVASNFNDDSLAQNVVELVLQKAQDASRELNLFGCSALHFAALKDRAPLVKYLIQKGADPTVANIRGQTPLHIAVRKQGIQAVQELVRNLSEEMICARDDFGQTPLHLACHTGSPLELITDLLVAGAHPNIPDRHGRTPIDLSLDSSRPELTDLLLAHNYRDIADFKLPPPYQPASSSRSSTETPYADCDCQVCLMLLAVSELRPDQSAVDTCTCPHHLTILCQDTMSPQDVIETTFATCNCKGCAMGRQRGVETPSCVPQHKFEPELDEHLEQSPVREGLSNAQLSPYLGHQYYDDLIDEQLSGKHDGLSLHEISDIAVTAFEEAGFRHKTSYHNNPEKVLAWVISNCHHLRFVWRMVGMLLDCGARADTTDKSGCTALHAAARNGNTPLAQILIERGASIDVPRQAMLAQKAYYTPARYALWFGKPVVLRQLLKAGADPDDQSVFNKRTLLHEAVCDFERSGEHIPMLLAHGARLDLEDVDSMKALNNASVNDQVNAASVLLDAGADVDVEGKNNASPLAMALEKGHTEMIMLLLRHGADIHAPCCDMPCALFSAVTMGHVGVVATLLQDYSGADDIHYQDTNGRGILHILSNLSVGNILENVDLLIKHGADVHLEDNSGSTPLHEAAKVGSVTMIERLLANGAMPNALNHAGKTPLDIAQAKRHRESVEFLGGTLEVKKSRWFGGGGKIFKVAV